MKRSQRGAARVSVVWVIVFGILFLIGAAYGVLASQDTAQALKDTDAAKDAAKQSEDAQAEADRRVATLSKAVGWFDAQSATAQTDLNALKSDLDELKATFSDMGSDVATLQAALPIVKAAYNARVQEIRTLTDAKTQLEGEKKALEDGLRAAVAQKDTELENLRKQLNDEVNNGKQRESELESRVASLNTQRTELDAQLREQRGNLDKALRDFEAERQTFETKRKSDRKVLKFLEEPAAADGEVLQVSQDVSLGWINIGAQQRLARGTIFDVRSGAPGQQRIKAMAEVTEVKADMAEVKFTNIADRFDPVVSGDEIFNPLFDPIGERRAALCGRFSGQFNEAELKILLANMGITVQPKLSIDTDYLIVGSELYVDETGQPLEEPLQPSELPVFKDAEASGVHIVSLDKLRSYFKF